MLSEMLDHLCVLVGILNYSLVGILNRQFSHFVFLALSLAFKEPSEH